MNEFYGLFLKILSIFCFSTKNDKVLSCTIYILCTKVLIGFCDCQKRRFSKVSLTMEDLTLEDIDKLHEMLIDPGDLEEIRKMLKKVDESCTKTIKKRVDDHPTDRGGVLKMHIFDDGDQRYTYYVCGCMRHDYDDDDSETGWSFSWTICDKHDRYPKK